MTTPQGRPLHEAGRHGEAFRSPSSPEEDPPKTNFVGKGYDPDCKEWILVTVLGGGSTTFVFRLTYSSAEGWPVGGHGAMRMPFGAGPPGKGFFLCLEASTSKFLEAALFFP